MQTCKGEQAFSPRMPTLHQREENDLNALGFEPLLKISSMTTEGIPKKRTKLSSVLFKSSLQKQVRFS